MSTPDVKRLHITPLDPPLLNTILNPTVRPLAKDVSFHSIQTFPERSYGFVTLPTTEADKLVKKLNGAILKGKKLQIHEAKQPKEIAHQKAGPVDRVSAKPPHVSTMGKKRKAGNDAIEGYELPPERRVKRGWTEVPEKTKRSQTVDKIEDKKDDKRKKSQKSKYTSEPECLFRTVPPPNKAEPSKSEKKKRSKSTKGDTVVVHEFEKLTTHPTFLRTDQNVSSKDLTSEYVEGKGWVDRAGNVKETPKLNRKKGQVKEAKLAARSLSKPSLTTFQAKDVSNSEDDETSSSGSSSEEDLSDLDSVSSTTDTPSEKSNEDSLSDDPSLRIWPSSSEEDGDDSASQDSKYSISNMAAKALYSFYSEDETNESSLPPSSSPKVSSTLSSELNDSESSSPPPTSEISSSSLSGSDDNESSPAPSTAYDSSTSSSESDVDDEDVDIGEEHEHKEASAEQRQTIDGGSAPPATTPQKEVHPLEALFKRPSTKAANPTMKPPLEVNTGFSFFGNAEENSDIEENEDDNAVHQVVLAEPQTPFTQKDLQWRALRSGAPTPDTAAVSKFKFWEDAEEEEDDEDEGDIHLSASKGVEGTKKLKDAANDTKEKEQKPVDESEFAKWFWDNRGDNNRAWKKRRREAAKEKRQRENRQWGRR